MNTALPADRERALELLEMRAWPKRLEGMKMLASLGETALLVQYALAETDAATVVDAALAALHPAPVELVSHYVSMGGGLEPNTAMRFHVPTRNHLYAEDALTELYRKRKSKLKPKVIDAIGLAYLQKMGAEFLPRYLVPAKSTKPLGTALAPMLTEETVAAAIALRRLDTPIDVNALRARVENFLEICDIGNYQHAKWYAQLEWVLFDAGEQDAFEFVVELAGQTEELISDIATTLLKRERYADLEWYARTRPRIGRTEFCFWPLADYLAKKGISENLRPAVANWRSHDMEPPPWWKWL